MGTVAALEDGEGVAGDDRDEPDIVDVPTYDFLMIDGFGDLETSIHYRLAVHALYLTSFRIMLAVEMLRGLTLAVAPLEALWWTTHHGPVDSTDGDGNRRGWEWTLMMRQPDEVPLSLYDGALTKTSAVMGGEIPSLVRVGRFREGDCAQLTHRGSVHCEGPDIGRLHEFMALRGLHRRGAFHEIYSANPYQCPPGRLRTVLRQPVQSGPTRMSYKLRSIFDPL